MLVIDYNAQIPGRHIASTLALGAVVASVLALVLPMLLRDAWRFTALQLGDDRARGLGVAVDGLRLRAFVAVSLLTGAAVASKLIMPGTALPIGIVTALIGVPFFAWLVLLLDEPTSALDIAHQIQVRGLLRDATRRRGLTTIAVLHDLNAAARFADRMALLAAGRLIALGTAETILTAGTLRAGFGVEAAVLAGPDGRPVVVPLGVTEAA